MTFEGKIDIATVLDRLNDSYDERTARQNFFGLRFIDRNGNVHEKEIRKDTFDANKEFITRNKKSVNLKEKGLVQVRERDASHPITPKVATIFGFKDSASSTWQRVYH